MEELTGRPMCIRGAGQLGTLLQSDLAEPIHWETSDITIEIFLGLVRFSKKVSSSLLHRGNNLPACSLVAGWEKQRWWPPHLVRSVSLLKHLNTLFPMATYALHCG